MKIVQMAPQPAPIANPPIAILTDGWVITGITLIVLAGLGGMKILLSRAIVEVDNRLKKIEEVQTEVQQLKNEVARDYVLKTEWIASFARLESKVDALFRRQDQVFEILVKNSK